MTVKELQRLKRQELLQLLLTQSKEAAELQADQEEADREILAFTDSNERLYAKVHEKDLLIDKLSGRLDSKTVRIQELETGIERLRVHRQAEINRTDSVAGASLRLNGIFAAAQKAIDQYLYNIRQRCEAGRTRPYMTARERLQSRCRYIAAAQERLMAGSRRFLKTA